MIRALERAGHRVVDRGDVVIAVGGDGTITRVARTLVGGRRPLLLVPAGTANNVARSLGIAVPPSPTDYVLEVLAAHEARRLDVGVARGGWGLRRFHEGAGVGLFADALADLLTERDKHPRRAARRLARFLDTHEPPALAISLDGVDASGRYTLVEVMNVAMLGPNLHLSPGADPCDGFLDVVLIGGHEAHRLRDYLAALAAGEAPPPPPFHTRRARRVDVGLGGHRLRLDGDVVRRTGAAGAATRFEVLPGALTVWLPPRAAGPPLVAAR